MTVYLTIDDLMAVSAAAVAPNAVVVRDYGLLESAMARPRASAFGADAYPTLNLKASALLESLARNHPLVDGNKRLAWVSTRLFLVFNDDDVHVPDPVEGDAFVRAVAQGQVTIDEIAETLLSWR